MPQLDSFTAPVFEEICRQYLWRVGPAGKLPFIPLRVGGWWRANEEIDVAVLGEEAVLLAECKWSSRPVELDVLHELERKARLASDETSQRRRYLALCSRSAFTPQVEQQAAGRDDLFLFDLPQIVAG